MGVVGEAGEFGSDPIDVSDGELAIEISILIRSS